MSDKKRKFFSGRSIEQAVMAASSYYGVPPEELAYREIEKKHGFVRVRRNAVIAVDPESLRKGPGESPVNAPAPVPAPAPSQAPASRRQAPAKQESRRATEAEEPPAAREREEEPRRERSRPDRRRGGEARREREAEAPEPPVEERPVQEAEETESSDAAPTPGWWHAPRVGKAGDEDDDQGGERAPARRVDRSQGLTRGSGGSVEAPRESGGGRGRGTGGRRAEAEETSRPGGRRGRRRPSRREEPPEPPQPEPPRERPAPRSERLPALADEELADAVLDALDMLLEFVDVEAEAELFRNDERIEVELYGPDDHILLEDEGQLLLAIEHLLPRMLRGLYGDAFPVRVDCADFHFEREERLREVARRTADEVRRLGKPRTVDDLDPAERRIVHMALADDPSVETESVGSGYYKRLKVIPR